MFSRPFTYLPARPNTRPQGAKAGASLEEHFVTINLDEGYEGLSARPEPGHKGGSFDEWVKHCSSSRVDTDTFLTNYLRSRYPDHSLVVTDDWQVNILNMEGIMWKPMDEVELQSHVRFIPPRRRNLPGQIVRSIRFGGFNVEWKEEKFIMYIASWSAGYGDVTQHFVLKEGKDEQASLALVMASGSSTTECGKMTTPFGKKYKNLIGKTAMILSPDFKQEIQSDVNNFFASEAIYHELAVPWKRGVIFLGPPGNGKTISIKALMKSTKHPALYVKSFKSWMGEEGSMKEVFGRARREAPCLLILEDLDALINDQNRSFFLNEIDGLENNDGLFILGTTNHFERLDPGLSDRPSRFDRKYTFSAPNRDERIQYAQYWQRKLKNNKDITFPDSLVEKVADQTAGFSFAYLKEAFVATLVSLAGSHNEGQFEKLLLKQISELRKQLGNSFVPEAPARIMARHLTPEQQARALARKKKKEAAAASSQNEPSYMKLLRNPAAKVLAREWLHGGDRKDGSTLVATWNILAQILVRRDLFLGSDCLRTTQRHPMILAEIISHTADIFCLQEVDRKEKLLPTFHEAGFSESFGCGRGKKHGCMILYRTSRYRGIAERVVFYDEESVRQETPDEDGVNRSGSTHRTKNIGLLVALQDRTDPSAAPVIVATTHLFWHGLYKYERARQVGILRREALRFREQHGTPESPIIMAGDFNFQPDEAAYALLRGVPLTPDQYTQLDSSRVIHVSLDPTVPRTPRTGTNADDDDEAAGSGAAVRTDLNNGDEEDEPVVPTRIKDSRPAEPKDGLLSNEEMVELFKVGGETRSAYDEILGRCAESTGEADNVLAARDPVMQGRKGGYEPMWTCFTHYWRSTLDYVFIIDPSEGNTLEVVDALKSPRTEALGDGLPRLRVSASDHVPLAVILAPQKPEP
ncbi:hypothetical protein FRC06_004619 [Ceratobasidium sp. 370]|nr:hypothetical protein FRC06_004619 [Ceratobasidium sp. 370]